MKELCTIIFDGTDTECNNQSNADISERLDFEFGPGELSPNDIKRKKQAEEQLFHSAKKCFDNGECEPLDILALRWKKCDACSKELPSLKKHVVDPLRDLGVSVLYEEIDAKLDPGGKEIFINAGCQGTPCILVADPSTGEYKKVYEGRQGSIARLSNILKIPNPLFYGDIVDDIKPLSMVRGNEDKKIIKHNRSVSLW